MHNTNETFPTYEDIEARAYEIYLERGQEDGHADEHWLEAEEQLLRERGERLAVPLNKETSAAGQREDFSSAMPRTKTVAVGQQRK